MVDENDLMEGLREGYGTEFEVIGFLGRRDSHSFVFLARERATGALLSVQLEEDGHDSDGDPSYSIDIVRQLDQSVPDEGALCHRCKNRLRKWVRYCTQCGADVTGIGISTGGSHSRTMLLSAVREAADDDLEVLGDMPRAAGGGLVYFARERSTGRIVALRLDREQDEEYSLSVTRVIKPLPRRPAGGGPAGGPAAAPRSVSMVRRLTAQEREQVENARRRAESAAQSHGDAGATNKRSEPAAHPPASGTVPRRSGERSPEPPPSKPVDPPRVTSESGERTHSGILLIGIAAVLILGAMALALSS